MISPIIPIKISFPKYQTILFTVAKLISLRGRCLSITHKTAVNVK